MNLHVCPTTPSWKAEALLPRRNSVQGPGWESQSPLASLLGAGGGYGGEGGVRGYGLRLRGEGSEFGGLRFRGSGLAVEDLAVSL